MLLLLILSDFFVIKLVYFWLAYSHRNENLIRWVESHIYLWELGIFEQMIRFLFCLHT